MLLSGLAPGTAKRVHRRLRKAERHARRIVARNRSAVVDLAARLLEVETLEGEDLAKLLPDR
jgi:ATP-dependent Zn protease